MSRDDIVAALQTLRPTSEWSMRGETLDSVEWMAAEPKPTQQEVDAEITRLAGVASAESSRVASIIADPGRIDLLDRLRTATPAQIDAWIDNNVTTIAAARAVFKAIIKAIALDYRR